MTPDRNGLDQLTEAEIMVALACVFALGLLLGWVDWAIR